MRYNDTEILTNALEIVSKSLITVRNYMNSLALLYCYLSFNAVRGVTFEF